jgi:hypothetical protein
MVLSSYSVCLFLENDYLSSQLLKQFLLSPFCRSVTLLGHKHLTDSKFTSKLIDACSDSQHYNLYVSASGKKQDNIEISTDHITSLQKLTDSASDLSLQHPAVPRLSIFRPYFITEPTSQSSMKSVLLRVYPIVSQFAAVKYREISAEDLALAIRLNAEICDSLSRVEYLFYSDIMRVIGKSDQI